MSNPLVASNDDRFFQPSNAASLGVVAYGRTRDGVQVPLLLGPDGGLTAEPPTTPWNYVAATGGITNTTAVTLAAAAGVGLANYLTSLTLHNKAATASEFTITDQVSGSTLYLGWAPASMSAPITIQFPTPLASGPNSALQFACGTTATATYVNASGYVEASSAQLVAVEQNILTLFDDNGAAITDDAGVNITVN